MSSDTTKLIDEIGNTHEGSLGIALSFVDMAASTGVDIVKFQMHIPEYESTKDEPFRNDTFLQDKTRFNYWERVSFSMDEWIKIKEHCDLRGVEFLCTPFSLEAAKLLSEHGLIKRWKIGSGEISNIQLLDYVLKTGQEVLVSTGLTTEDELETLVQLVERKYDIGALVLMHCVSQYPTRLEDTSLKLITQYRDRFETKVGFSDHSGNISTSVLALTLPISSLEVHVKPHDLFFGPDISSSLRYDELKFLVKFKNDLTVLRDSKLSRNELFEKSAQNAKIFRKGLYWARPISAGEIVLENDINLRKPEVNISAFDLYNIVGRTLTSPVEANTPVELMDFQ